MHIICSDLEGIYVPEIWVNVAIQTGIDDLKLTTRDISDYDVLMKRRIEILKKHNLKLIDIQNVISGISPLTGALEFLNWIRSQTQIIVVSDTFLEFAGPLMKHLGYPTLLCHHLITDENGMITGYKLRQSDSKKKVAAALQSLNYTVTAIGDSYNDISMLRQANTGILFNPPKNVIEEHGDLPITRNYEELKKKLQQVLAN
jgi:phosphoserine/homoserine phosphotransferase